MFTDIEGSTRLLQELGGERYGAELERHRERVRRAIAARGGFELGTDGDAFFIAFARASDALGAASEVQAALANGPIRVRIGIHTGEPLIVDGELRRFGRAQGGSDLRRAAHGGQVLVSQATRELAGDGLRELGEFRLKDLTAPERLFQLGTGEFPPLRTLRPTNLPVQPGPLLGRREELADLLALAQASRLVTLTGPGGSGKTRLALALAGELSDDYRDGAWWVPLAAVTDPGLVLPTIAQSLGARDELPDHLAGKRVLLLLGQSRAGAGLRTADRRAARRPAGAERDRDQPRAARGLVRAGIPGAAAGRGGGGGAVRVSCPAAGAGLRARRDGRRDLPAA